MPLPPDYEPLRAALVRWLRGDDEAKPLSPEHAIEVVITDTFNAFEAASAPQNADTLNDIRDEAHKTCQLAGLDVSRDSLADAVAAEAAARRWPHPDGSTPLPPHEFVPGGDAESTRRPRLPALRFPVGLGRAPRICVTRSCAAATPSPTTT